MHVPFCAVRCGYCDFNTYTATELGDVPGASRASYADAAIAEIRFARRVLGDVDVPVETVFFGGGTPTLLPPHDLTRIVAAIGDEFGLAPGRRGHHRVQPGQRRRRRPGPAARGRRHPGVVRHAVGGRRTCCACWTAPTTRSGCPQVVGWAREAGFDQVSLDLIYGTPGESLDDWRTSLEAALACEPDHVSAYALIVEEGTALARQIRRGEVPMTDDDDLADKYLLADEAFERGRPGLVRGVELGPHDARPRCRHNVLYWTGGDWWGVGPGAHAHVGGVRWWNVKHPTPYAVRIGERRQPGARPRGARRRRPRRVERVLLETRLRQGLPVDVLDDAGRAALPDQVARGLVEQDELAQGRVVLTTRGRLLADAVVRDLLT